MEAGLAQDSCPASPPGTNVAGGHYQGSWPTEVYGLLFADSSSLLPEEPSRGHVRVEPRLMQDLVRVAGACAVPEPLLHGHPVVQASLLRDLLPGVLLQLLGEACDQVDQLDK